MHHRYEDITSRIAEPPTWYDEHGTPRYGVFHPSHCPDIYTTQVVLLRIACADCHERFDVEIHAGLFEELKPMKLHYGDPPSHGCVGDSMNCDDLAVLQVWHKPFPGEWVRHPEMEGFIDDRSEPQIGETP